LLPSLLLHLLSSFPSFPSSRQSVRFWAEV
jgi:hypothetical protein